VIKILIQRADRLGDLVLALPVLERLNETLPHAELHLLVSPIGKPLAATLPFIKKMIVTHSAKKKRSYWKLIQSIKHEHYSLYLSLWNHPKMAYLGFLAQIPIRIGDATNPTLRWLYTHPVPQSWKNFCKHQAFFNMELLKPLHSNALLLTKKLYINSATEEKVRLLMLKSLNPNKRVVLIFTDSGGSNLSLPEHAIKTFCDRLLENQLFNIVLIGGKQKGLSPLCFYKAKDVLNLLDHPSLPLPELMAFIKLSDFYVGPDTGPTHIASFLEKPILYFSALKSNPPSRWGPLSSYFSIIRKDYLSPHFCKPSCNPRICLHYMTGDLLYTHFQSLLLQVQKRLPLSEKEQETRRLLHSLRVLYFVPSKLDSIRVFPLIHSLRKQGLCVFPFYWKQHSFVSLLKIITRRNINVLQGKAPLWLIKVIQFVMGVGLRYIKPVYVEEELIQGVGLHSYLRLYKEKWKQEAK